MLPFFNADGNLPPGIHQATEAEVLSRFGVDSARRQWLGERFADLLQTARSSGVVKRVFLWGSFVTAKERPNDLDVLLVTTADLRLESVADSDKVLFDHAQSKIRFRADVFWCKESIGQEMLDLWLDTYQTGRDLKRKGIVEVVLI